MGKKKKAHQVLPRAYRTLRLEFSDGAIEIPYLVPPQVIILGTPMPDPSLPLTYRGQPVRVEVVR